MSKPLYLSAGPKQLCMQQQDPAAGPSLTSSKETNAAALTRLRQCHSTWKRWQHAWPSTVPSGSAADSACRLLCRLAAAVGTKGMFSAECGA